MAAAETIPANTGKGRGPRKGAGGRGPKPKMTKEERRKKYTDIARKRRQKQNGTRHGGGNKNSVCYNCRQPGHNAADCPEANKETVCTIVGSKDGSSSATLCYKCGSTEHALHNCPKRHRGDPTDLPYATCFICGEKGHLASACSQNKHGIYVNGGSCRFCGSQQHLATNCPEKKKRKKEPTESNRNDKEQALLDEALQVEDDPGGTISQTKKTSKETKKLSLTEPKKKKRVVNF